MGRKKGTDGSGGGKPGRRSAKVKKNKKNGSAGGRGKKAIENPHKSRPRFVVVLFEGYGAVGIAAERLEATVLVAVDKADDCIRAVEINIGHTGEGKEETAWKTTPDGLSRVECKKGTEHHECGDMPEVN